MKAFTTILLSLLVLGGCGASLEDAKKAGFSSIEEYKNYYEKGFPNMESFIETGFSTLQDYERYSFEGFKSFKSFQQTGFNSLNQYKQLRLYGKTMNEVLEFSGVSLQKFKECDSGSNYKTDCENNIASMYALVKSYSSTGVKMQLLDDCSDTTNSKAVDAINLSKEYFDLHQEKCTKVLFRIGSENWFTPDVHIIETLWIETEKELQNRKEKEEIVQQQKLKMELEELEINKVNVRWLADKYLYEAGMRCQSLVENLARYDFEWTDGMIGFKFPKYVGSTKQSYVLTVTGDKIKFQNGFGAWQRKDYYCDYNVKEGRALRAYIR